MTTDLDNAINKIVNKISEIPEEELIVISRIIERAYIHILVEQGLRVNIQPTSVSHIT